MNQGIPGADSTDQVTRGLIEEATQLIGATPHSGVAIFAVRPIPRRMSTLILMKIDLSAKTASSYCRLLSRPGVLLEASRTALTTREGTSTICLRRLVLII